MGSSVLRRAAVFTLLAAASACPESTECSAATPCTSPRVCEAGRCVTPVDAGVADAGAGGGSSGGMAGGTAGGTGGGRGSEGERCDTALPLTPGTPVSNSTVAARNDVALRCTGFLNRGPDLVYSLTVPSGQRLVARVTPEPVTDGGFVFDPSLSLVAGPASQCVMPDAGTCLGGRDELGADTVSWSNEGAAPQDVFLVVDSYLNLPDPNAGTTFEGRFTLDARLEIPGGGDRCDIADVVPATGMTMSTLAAMGPDISGTGVGCRVQSGPDRVFQLVVPAGERLSATATPATDGGLDVVVNLIAAPSAQCRAMPLTCLASADVGFRGQADTALWFNGTPQAQRVFVVVGSYFTEPGDEAFTFTTEVAPPPTGDTCANATRLDAGVALTAQSLAGYTNDLEQSDNCASDTVLTAAERFYAVEVPAGKQLTATVTPQPTLDTLLSVIDGASSCVEPVTCLAGDVPTLSPTGQPDVLSVTNRRSMAQTFLIAVDSRRGTSGTFDLVTSLSDPPDGDFCALAVPLALGTPVSGSTVGATNDYQPAGGGCSSDSAGPDVAYALSAPPGVRTLVTVTPTPSADGGLFPSLHLIGGPASTCEARPLVCLGSVDAVATATPRQASVVNGQSTAVPLFAVVDAFSGAGAFTLLATTSPLTPNDVCTSAATPLSTSPPTAPVPLTGQALVGFERDYACNDFATGPDRVYPLTLAPLERVTLTVTPTPTTDAGSFDPVLSVIDGPASACDGPTRQCLDTIDLGGRGAPETLVVQNVSGARTVYAVVGAYDSVLRDTTFSLVATSEPISMGDICERATPVSVTNTLTGSLSSAGRDYLRSTPMSCAAYSGADLVFAVTFSASFSVVVTPDAASDAVVNVLDGPASACSTATACLASANAGADGQPEVVALTNPLPMTRTVYVVVSRRTQGPMTFSFAATLN